MANPKCRACGRRHAPRWTVRQRERDCSIATCTYDDELARIAAARVRRIEKLRALAAHPGTAPGEAAAAREAIRRLKKASITLAEKLE